MKRLHYILLLLIVLTGCAQLTPDGLPAEDPESEVEVVGPNEDTAEVMADVSSEPLGPFSYTTVTPCGGEGERPCGITTAFFWENGGLFADRGLKATGFRVLPDISFNANDWIDLTQLDATQYRPYQAAFERLLTDLNSAVGRLERLVTQDWEALEQRITNLSANDFVTPTCLGISQGGGCWVTPPFSLEGWEGPLSDECIPLKDIDFLDVLPDPNCTVDVPGIPSALVPVPTFSESGWKVPEDLGAWVNDVVDAVADLVATRLYLPNGEIVIPDFIVGIPDLGPLPETALGDFADSDPLTVFLEITTALTDFKTLFSENNPFIRTFVDLVNDFVAPPGVVVNDTRRQATAAQFQSTWEYWALSSQRELGRYEPLNWTQYINTHNAFNNRADGYLFPNQSYSMTDQLRMGARALSLDIHWFNDHLRLCHGKAGHEGCSAVDRYYDSGIKEIANWLRANPDEVIVIGFEDHADGHDAWVNDPIAAHLAGLVYKPALSQQQGFTATKAADQYWPSLDQIRAAGKQVLLFSDDQHGGEWIWAREDNPFLSAKEMNFHFTDAAYQPDRGEPSPTTSESFSCWSYWDDGAGTYRFDRAGEQNTVGTFSSVYEARSVLDPFEAAGILTAARVAEIAQCPVTEVGLDFLNATEWSNPGACAGVPGCQGRDERMAAAVWSWLPGDSGDFGDAALFHGASARWRSADPAAEHRFACARPREGAASSWTDRDGSDWKITKVAGPWSQGGLQCLEEYGDDGYVFGVPHIGWQNEQLRLANLDQDDGMGDGAGRAQGDLWVNFNDIGSEGEWRVNRRPVPDAGVDLSVSEGEVVRFDASGSTDPDGDALSYHWDFGDGATATGVSPEHVFADDGSYTVTLTVEDPYAGAARITVAVSVANVAPGVGSASDQHIVEGATVRLPPVTFSDPGFDCKGCVPASQESFTASIDWGEGTVTAGSVERVSGGPGAASTGTVHGSHSYGDDGTYIVTVCVEDDDGGVGCGAFTVVVGNLDPSVTIDKAPAIAFPSGRLAFLARHGNAHPFTAAAADPGSDDLTASWTFPPASGLGAVLGETITYYNDGLGPDPDPSPGGTFPFEVTAPNVTSFSLPGVYTAEISVADDDGGGASDRLALVVSDNRSCTMGTAQWHHQFGPRGRQMIDQARLSAYLEVVRFASTVFDDENLADSAAAGVLLEPGGGDKWAALQREVLAAWLNFASGGIGWDEPVARSGLTFGQLIAQLEEVLLDPNSSTKDNQAAVGLARAVQNSRPGNPACDG